MLCMWAEGSNHWLRSGRVPDVLSLSVFNQVQGAPVSKDVRLLLLPVSKRACVVVLTEAFRHQSQERIDLQEIEDMDAQETGRPIKRSRSSPKRESVNLPGSSKIAKISFKVRTLHALTLDVTH